MRLDTSEPEEIKLNMTAMIDIVFQLLIFFIMTFKVVTMEGDFNIKMPLASTDTEVTIEDETALFISVRLIAGADGGINSIICDDEITFSDAEMFISLTDYVDEKISAEGDAERAEDTEVEFDIDYNLRYSFTVSAIEAVSGRVEPDGAIRKLVQKIKFKDNKKE